MKKILVMICFCLFAVVATAQAKVTPLTPEEADVFLAQNPDVFLIDVRSQAEYDAEHFSNSVLIPNTEIAARLNEIPTDKTIVLHCRSGKRATAVAQDILDKERPNQEIYYIKGAPIFK